MKIVDVKDPKRVNKIPSRTTVLLSGNFVEKGYSIKTIRLNLYLDNKKPKPYSLITSQVETDKGTIEMTYEEGYLADGSLEKAAYFLQSNLGLSGLILRSIIALDQNLKQNTHNI